AAGNTLPRIEIHATRSCPSGNCELGVKTIPVSAATLIENIPLEVGGVSLSIGRGRTAAELSVRSKPAASDQWSVDTLAVVAEGGIQLNVFDGGRQLLKSRQLLVRVLDGNRKAVMNGYYSASNLLFKGLPIADSFA